MTRDRQDGPSDGGSGDGQDYRNDAQGRPSAEDVGGSSAPRRRGLKIERGPYAPPSEPEAPFAGAVGEGGSNVEPNAGPARPLSAGQARPKPTPQGTTPRPAPQAAARPDLGRTNRPVKGPAGPKPTPVKGALRAERIVPAPPSQIKPSQIKPSRPKPSQAMSGHAKSDQAKPDPTNPTERPQPQLRLRSREGQAAAPVDQAPTPSYTPQSYTPQSYTPPPSTGFSPSAPDPLGGELPPEMAGYGPEGGTGSGGAGGGQGGSDGDGREPPRQSVAKRLLIWALRQLGRAFRWIGGVVFSLFWRGALVVVGIVALVTLYNMSMLPPAEELADGRVRGSVTMTDRYGETFAWRGDQYGGLVMAEDVSPNLRNAVIATEDRRFYGHWGISPRGIASAVRINLAEGRGPLSGNGGSTISQQVAKLLCLGNAFDPNAGMTEAEYEADCREGSVWRKIREVPYAFALEGRFTKDEILSIYLNRAYLGAGARGFEAASQRYFNKSSADVTPAEAAMLAGLLVAPTRFAPTNNLERAQRRAATVIRLMEAQGFLTQAQADDAIANPAELSDRADARLGGSFADWVMDEGPNYLTDGTTEDVIIETTLDQSMQRATEEALQYIFDNKVREGSEAQAAIVVMSADGAVRAMVGGRNLRSSGQFNRATQAFRQTGSAFKPFVYAAALDLGWRYDDVLVDEPITIDIPGSGPWSPRNYTNEFYGPVTLTQALANSLNIPAVKLSEEVGRENVRTVASGFGVSRDMALGPALALGASEASLIGMTAAYAGILNGGRSVSPYGMKELRLRDEAAPLMDQSGGMGERVISEQAARQLTYMMHQVIENGTGARAKLPNHEAAGKTGTTQAARDAWFVGFTADYVAGVWMGYDDNRPLTGVTGGGLPAEIWHETMTRIHAQLEPLPLPMTLPPPKPVQPQPQPTAPTTPTPQNAAERVLLEVLGAILGGN